MTPTFAPPWSGPLRAPMPETTPEYMSERVATVTRAANVEAFSSWSAWRISAVSIAFSASALGFRPVSM